MSSGEQKPGNKSTLGNKSLGNKSLVNTSPLGNACPFDLADKSLVEGKSSSKPEFPLFQHLDW